MTTLLDNKVEKVVNLYIIIVTNTLQHNVVNE